jgi:cytochrome c-type biogenesis protein
MFADLQIYLGVALAGLVSFLSPCVLPLVPPYLGYLGGTTIDEFTAEGGVPRHVWSRVVLASVLFVLGFTTVFVGLGAGASYFGQLIQSYKRELEIVAGLVIILFGLPSRHIPHLAALPRGPLPSRTIRVAASAPTSSGWPPRWTRASASAGDPWRSPPTGSLVTGVKLLFVYSLGLGIPFILAAIAIQPFISFALKLTSTKLRRRWEPSS